MTQPTAGAPDELTRIFRRLMARGPDALAPEDRLRLLWAARLHSRDQSRQLDRLLLEETTRLHDGLERVRQRQAELEQTFARLTAPPWHAAVFVAATDTPRGPQAIVAHNGATRLVGAVDELDLGGLRAGEEVLLGPELNVVVGTLPQRLLATGETATFDRWASDGRMIVRARDEEIVLQVAADLRADDLRPGDQVRWHRTVGMAFERIERATGEHLFLEDSPSDTFADVGGLDTQVGELQRVIRLHLQHPDAVRRYRLRRKASVLLSGPPGTGKTLLARALAHWLGELSGAGRSRFMNIKPGSLHSMWYAQSEANYREAFRLAREAGARDPDVPVVMFFDEVDAIGAARGDSLHRVDDRVLTALMTELDGLESRGNILVVAATNRRDALDPALLRPGRLGDLVLEIPRPGRAGARQIFQRHLPADVPCADGAAGPRDALIEAAVSRLYAPNGLGELASVTLRDGRRRAVTARDLVSGAAIAAICRTALERACLRDAETGERGLRLTDLLDAIDGELRSAAATLSPANCHRHLDGLPQDVDVVRVEPVLRPARREHRVLRVA
jgi:proteasome-associated ATPase